MMEEKEANRKNHNSDLKGCTPERGEAELALTEKEKREQLEIEEHLLKEHQQWAQKQLLLWQKVKITPSHHQAIAHLGKVSTLVKKMYTSEIDQMALRWIKEAGDLGPSMQEMMILSIIKGDSLGQFRTCKIYRELYETLVLEIQSRTGPQRENPPGEVLDLLRRSQEATGKPPQQVLDTLEKALGFCDAKQFPYTYAGILDDIGYMYKSLHDHEKALRHFQEALDVLEGIGPHSAEMGRLLRNVAGLYRSNGDFDKALGYYSRALQIDQAIALYSVLTSTDLNQIGNLYFDTGDHNKALEHYQQSLDIAETINPLSRETAVGLNNIASVYRERGRLNMALSYLQRALNIEKALCLRSEGTAAQLNNIAQVYQELGDPDVALEFFEHALEIRQAISPRSPGIAMTLNNMSGIYLKRGDIEMAVKCMQQCLEIESAVSPRSSRTATYLSNLGGFFHMYGDLEMAERYYEKALEMDETVCTQADQEAAHLNNIGAVLIERGDLHTALRYLQKALDINQHIASLSPSTAICLNNLGYVYYKLVDLDRAMEYFQKALEMNKEIAASSSLTATILGNIAMVYEDRGDITAALSSRKQALEIELAVAPHSIELSRELNNVALLLIKTEDYQEAEKYCEMGVEIIEELRKHAGGRIEARTGLTEYAGGKILLAGLVVCKAKMGKWKEAFFASERGKAKCLSELLAESEIVKSKVEPKIRSQMASLEGKIAFLERKLIDLREEQAILETSDKGKQLACQPRYKPELLRGDLERQIALCSEELMQAKKQLEYVLVQLRADHRIFADLRYPEPINLEEAQRHLSIGTLALEFFTTEIGTYAFAITKHKFASCEATKIDEDFLREAVQERMRPFIANRDCITMDKEDLAKTRKRYCDVSLFIYENLLQPFKELLEDAERLIIVPDGYLHFLPFETLIMKLENERPVYFGDRYPISYMPSLTVMKQISEQLSRRRQPSGEELIAFGDPDCENIDDREEKGEDVSPLRALQITRNQVYHLPHAREEVLCIGELIAGEKRPVGASELLSNTEAQDWKSGITRVLVRSKASEKIAKSKTRDARILHFATHGFIDDKRGMNSGLVLSPTAARKDSTETERYDYLLQAFEIFELDIAADLVVLSACETGLGEMKRGEGIIGMVRAWFYAGTPNVVVSLWPVEDVSTSVFMQKFYQELYGLDPSKGLSTVKNSQHLSFKLTPAEALRRARVYLRDVISKKNNYNLVYDHPYFWAAFVHYGLPTLPAD